MSNILKLLITKAKIKQMLNVLIAGKNKLKPIWFEEQPMKVITVGGLTGGGGRIITKS